LENINIFKITLHTQLLRMEINKAALSKKLLPAILELKTSNYYIK